MFRSIYSFVRKYWVHGLVGVALAVAVLYVEEDWRGARAWADEKAAWEAKGESFDRAKFVPPSVPEEQNLAALPILKLGPMKGKDGETYLGLPALSEAIGNDSVAKDTASFGTWYRGELTDMTQVRAVINAKYGATFRDVKAPESALAQFDAIYPFINELRAASASRPFLRFDLDYSVEPSFQLSLRPVVDLLHISRLLALHGNLALHEKQGDLAIGDLQLNQELLSSAKRVPTLVGGLVAIGMRAISNSVIYDGLSEHAWTDMQLVEIDRMLKQLDFLSDCRFELRAEVISSLNNLDYLRQPGHHHKELEDLPPEKRPWFTPADFFAGGWWDNNERQIANFNFQELAVIDPQARKVFPDIALQLDQQQERAFEKWDAEAPWNIFFSIGAPVVTSGIKKFAEAQVSVDETRIACALERYRLARGVYPVTLAELAPTYLDELPHDIMNGEPYHYRLNADGTFLLYSVGWNQKDDGGTLAYMKNSTTSIDYEKGDWVWPTAKVAGKDKSQ